MPAKDILAVTSVVLSEVTTTSKATGSIRTARVRAAPCPVTVGKTEVLKVRRIWGV